METKTLIHDNQKVAEYATAILQSLPPKQAELHRMTVLKMCELLYLEAQVAEKTWSFVRLENLLEQTINEAQMIFGMITSRFFGIDICRNIWSDVKVRPEVDAMLLSPEGKKITEVLYQYFENEAKASTAKPA